MPKLKTKKSAAKRFEVKKSGKILRRHSMISHLRSKETTSRRHRKNRLEEVSKDRERIIKRLLPYS